MLKTLAHAVTSRPVLYQMTQVLLGQNRSRRQLEQVLSGRRQGRCLAIGSSAGALERSLVPDAVGVDIDVLPLLQMKRLAPGAEAVAGDAASLPFLRRTFDLSLCIAVSHHLDDDSLQSTFEEIRRVTRGTFVFLDAVRNDSRAMGRLLWRYDRGSHPRTRSELVRAIEQCFTIERTVVYRYLHEYLICVARPKTARPGMPGPLP